VRKVARSDLVTLVLGALSIGVGLTTAATVASLRSDDRVIALLATAIVAGLLVAYFDWRATLRNRLADPGNHREAT
jgi:hypothetical protein